ncbi:MAG: AAA family ATPase [Oscillospiraceae bacterium]|nr:AAA family ATPase [Oscillospiraceae bacterium]
MILRQMTASFGCLDHRTMELEPGLNLIEAPNESGKSTWCAFLRAMFYGMETKRGKRNELSDRQRYQPWNGAPMEGLLRCALWDGRTVTVQRETRRAAAPMGECTVRDEETGETLELGPQPGLQLLGVEEAVFVRSAFIRTGELAVESDDALEKRILSLLSDGEETMGREEAEKTLRQWQNDRRVNRATGRLPRLEAELHDVERRLEEVRAAAGRVAGARRERDALRRRKLELEQQLRIHDWYETEALYAQAQAARADYEETETRWAETCAALTEETPERNELLGLRDELIRMEALRDSAEDAQTAGQVDEAILIHQRAQFKRAEEDCLQAAALGKRKFPVLPVLFAVLTALCFVLGTVLATALPLYVGLACLVVFAVTLVLWIVRETRRRRRLTALLEPYGVTSLEAMSTSLERLREDLDAAEEAGAFRQAAEEKYEKFCRMEAELREKIGAFAPGEDMMQAVEERILLREKLARLEDRLANLRRQNEELGEIPAPEGPRPELPRGSRSSVETERDRIDLRLRELDTLLARAEGERNARGDPADLQARREALMARREALTGQWDALAVAREELEGAHEDLSSRFSPRLNETAAAIFHQLTGGRYEALTLDRSLSAVVQERSDTLSRDAQALSRGALDQLYLAVRLAICDLILPPDTPLILDDALAHFDETRMGHALEYFLTSERQILLFTCHAREGNYLAGRAGVHRVSIA